VEKKPLKKSGAMKQRKKKSKREDKIFLLAFFFFSFFSLSHTKLQKGESDACVRYSPEAINLWTIVFIINKGMKKRNEV
jgi:hypothetical protein